MSKQTAVEWLKSEVLSLFPSSQLVELFEEAKAMERQQIIEAHKQGQEFALLMNMPDSKEYYNETYKGDEQ